MDWMPFMIPITFILGAFAVGIVAVLVKSKAREHQHRERMFLAEKGLPIPPELYEVSEEKKPSEFRGFRAVLMVLGCVTTLVGISVMIALGVRDGMDEGVNGVIPFLIGIGMLVAERMINILIVKPGREQ